MLARLTEIGFMTKHLENLSDDEIDALLLLLFNGNESQRVKPKAIQPPKTIREFSDDDLLRIRSKNHPDKWPNVNQEAYQAAVEELDRRRMLKRS